MDHPDRDRHVPTTYLKAAAGGAGGSWYVLMEGLARLVAEIYPSLHIEVVEGGGVLIAALTDLGWTAAGLPAGAYGTVAQGVPTVAMGTALGFHASVSEDVVYAITRVICDHAERVRQMHPAAQDFDPGTAHLHSQGPLHPGAARYFRAQGRIAS